MDIKAIRQIIELMKSSELSEFEIEEEGFKLRICRGKNEPPTVLAAGTPPLFPAAFMEPSATATAPRTEAPGRKEDEVEQEPDIDFIKSPMVGTYYRSSSPDTPPFVEENTDVSEDTIVCIIEAMKVLNEIQAETKGTIIEILLENGTSVEFGQPLFKIKKR